MKLSIWAICTCDCKVDIGFYCWNHWLTFYCLYIVSLSWWHRCCWPSVDCTLQSGLKTRAQQRTTYQTVLDLCSLCVCIALRKRTASFSSCSLPLGSWEEWEGAEHLGDLSKSALSWEANFARLDCNFCFVLSMVFFLFVPLLGAFFSFLRFHSSNLLSFHSGVLEREKKQKQKLMFRTKQNLHTFFWIRAN